MVVLSVWENQMKIMLSILIDSNILLDVMATRQPCFETSSKVIETLKDKDITVYVSASSVTDIYYIARRELKDKELVIQLIKDILKFIKIATVSEDEINKALELEWSDFEDAVQYSTALLSQMDYIITRNAKDFKASEVLAISPEDFFALLEPEDSET